MKLKKVNTVKLTGYLVEIESVGDSIKSISFKSESEFVKITPNYYGGALDILIPEPPKMITKYRVAGDLIGLKIDEIFDSYSDADKRCSALLEAGAQVLVEDIQVEEMPE